MSKLADYLARRLWWGMLWVMRRSWMRRAQRAALRLVPERRRAGARRSQHKQDAFARRYGLRIVRTILTLALAYVTVVFFAYLVVGLIESGVLVQPEIERP